MLRSWLIALALATFTAAGCQKPTHEYPGGGENTDDAGSGNGSSGSSAPAACSPAATDLVGCSCGAADTSRACYPSTAPTVTRNVGACRDGMQECTTSGEFPVWGMCIGAVVPTTENCDNGIDDDCNGKADCQDPACASSSSCGKPAGCQDGQQQSCYDGPSGTEGVGVCHGGMQTCSNGMWGPCTGEHLPEQPVCTDNIDHACNHFPGCLNLIACALASVCQNDCSTLDPSCVCPMGDGDQATCPDGYIGVDNNNSLLGGTECCPCTQNDCGNPGCCAETVCAGDSRCQGLVCAPLPASCNGMVNADCDDFPEDCDEPCCKCRDCP